MYSFIRWIRTEGVESIQELFQRQFTELRLKASQSNVHAKLSEQTALLQFSLSLVLNWVMAKGVITDSRVRELSGEGWSIFLGLMKEGQKRLHDEDPVCKFKDILGTLIYQGKVRLEHKEYAGDFMGGDSGASDRIGWYDDNFFYLMPTPMWKAIQGFTYASQEVFPVKKDTLYGMLSDKKLLEEREGRHTISFKKDSKAYRVLKLLREGINQIEVTGVTEGENDT
jgi:hypothetical protein